MARLQTPPAMTGRRNFLSCDSLDGSDGISGGNDRHMDNAPLSDCWPDWATSIEDPATIEALARKNSPAIVFGEIGRVLAVVIAAIILINVSLNLLHIH